MTRIHAPLQQFFLLAACLLCASAGLAQDGAKQGVSVDLLVKGATIVTMDANRHVFENGFIAVRGDEIIAVGADAAGAFPKGITAKQTIDASGKLIIPGLINGHTHIPMVLMRGLKDDVTLDDWLRKFIFPAEARNVTEEYVRWGSRLALAEMIRSGTTTFADMYYFEDAEAEETKAAGLRGVLGETWIDFPVPDNKNEAEMTAYTEKFLKKWQGDPLIHAAVAPHSIYTCSEKTLRDAAAMARKYHAPILIHVSEMRKEFTDSIEKNGATPVQYLERIEFLGPDVVAAHCIWTDYTDMKILAERQVGCVHNPSSNMMLASGVAPVVDQRTAGMRVGLGTDGPAGSNNDLDMMEEMDLAAKLQKTYRVDPRALGAKGALEMATIEGARALHMEKEIGSLETGKKADFVVLTLDVPNAVPMYDVYSQIVYALKASEVQTVVVGGKTLLQDGKLLTVDEHAAIAKAKEYGQKVAASLK
ncbi:MAG TPA: amidohydrolase [Candidatus Sulfotelmatobacter sp.]|jgi:5-methylthioadenosine/S-adenosylhomocysteine deaminase|nr:amidohydrolase [Candidatus Sulfotelmatobacter sp.]